MLKSVKLNFTETGSIELPAKGITIFVGPNNSGKSLVLREIEQAFNVHPFPTGLHILQDYEVDWPSQDSVSKFLNKMPTFDATNLPAGQIVLSRFNPGGMREQLQLDKVNLFNIVANKQDKYWFVTQYLRWGVVRLDGRSRFSLTDDRQGGDLIGTATNVLMHLFKDDTTRQKIRTLIKDAFGSFFVIDPTNFSNLRIRLSTKEPLADEQSLNAEARKFHAAATYIKDASDGVQAFTGILTAVCSGEYHTILIDEPEAFLHPPLARKLGKSLASLAAERSGSLMASTHSSDFLMGCLQGSKSVRVVRLEYNGGKSRARVIDPSVLETFFRRPLIRSANVISGLFHDGVVICESDNDRAFYSEIYQRLVDNNSDYPSILFVNAQNKQTIKDIMGPLRQFGIPAAAIPDVDLLTEGGAIWMAWLKAAGIPEALHTGYGQHRSAIEKALNQTGKKIKSEGGINVLEVDDKVAAESLLDTLEAYGIFTVRQGELENWLPSLAVRGKKTDWTVAMLQRLGSDPDDPSYVQVAQEDVWLFLQKVVTWVRNPARKGTA